MPRYIDADEVLEQIRKKLGIKSLDYLLEAERRIVDVIQSAPSIDIVRRKPVVGYEGYYEVDMYGNVYSVARTVQVNNNGRIYDKPVKSRKMTASKHSQGYRTVSLTKNGKTELLYIHRIVAEAYISNPQNLPYINHKDEDKTNNFVGNLEWCTASYNNTYNGKNIKHSEKLKGRKFTEEHKEKIRQSNIGKHHKGEREGE